jgi:hypothetical protein
MKGQWGTNLRHQGGEGLNRMGLLMVVRVSGVEPAQEHASQVTDGGAVVEEDLGARGSGHLT